MGYPKILSFDIETFPLVVETWGTYEQNALRVLREFTICAFTAKWLDGRCITKALPDYKGYKPSLLNIDDSGITKDIHKLFDEADIIVAHNGDQFDIKKVNSRFLVHNLPPPSPYKTIDTLKLAHSSFAFDSNKLGDLSRLTGGEGKKETGGYSLWIGCMNGDKKAWAKMKKYSRQDVIELEKLYKKFRPFAKTHPILGMYGDIEACPKCGVAALQNRGFAVNKTTKYQRVQCTSCGAWGRRTENIQEIKPVVNA